MNERKMVLYTGSKGKEIFDVELEKAYLKMWVNNRKIEEVERTRILQMIDGDETDRFIAKSILKQKYEHTR